jgi:hypothetical protein
MRTGRGLEVSNEGARVWEEELVLILLEGVGVYEGTGIR